MNRKLSVRKAAVLMTGSLIYALLYALCSQIDQEGITVPGRAPMLLLKAYPVAVILLAVAFRHILPKLTMKPDDDVRRFCTWGAWVFLFCCYIPMFLIQYPGSYTYDILPQAMQVASGEFNESHPILHTLLLRVCVNAYGVLGTLERCAALCTVIQMIAVSGCFACICASLARGVSRRAAIISLVFFAIYPSHVAFASTYTKDVMFSSFLALFLTLHAEATARRGLSAGCRVLYVMSGVISCMLRNNMIYAMAAWAAGMMIIAAFSRRCLRTALSVLLVTVLSVVSLNTLSALVEAEGGNIREMLSVPAQQMARVRLFAPEMLTEQERAKMDNLLLDCDYSRYDPTIADPIKNRLSNEAFKQDPAAAIRLWFDIGKKCPRIYLDAFLNLTLPSLYPYSSYRVSAPYMEVGECRDGLTLPFGVPQIQQPGRFAAIREWLNTHVYDKGMDDVPVLRYLFNTGFIYWLLLLFALYEAYCGHWMRLTWFMLPVLLWGTYLLGPVMQGRYLYPFICVLPLFVLRPKMMNMNPEG